MSNPAPAKGLGVIVAPSTMSRVATEKSWEGKKSRTTIHRFVYSDDVATFIRKVVFVMIFLVLELRRESRQLENEIDAKLNSFSKLSSSFLHRESG